MFKKLKYLCKNLNCKTKCYSDNEFINNTTNFVLTGITLKQKDSMRISKILDKYDLKDLLEKKEKILSSII